MLSIAVVPFNSILAFIYCREISPVKFSRIPFLHQKEKSECMTDECFRDADADHGFIAFVCCFNVVALLWLLLLALAILHPLPATAAAVITLLLLAN